MKLKTKRKLLVILCLLCVISATLVVPSYAYSYNGTVYVVDGDDNKSYSTTIPMDTSYNVLTVFYDPDEASINISCGQMDEINVVFKTFFPTGYTCTVEYGINYHEIDTADSTTYTWGGLAASDPFSITLVFHSPSDTEGTYMDGVADGIQFVLDNPSNYNLYTVNEYQSAYESGKTYVQENPHQFDLYTSDEYLTARSNGINYVLNNPSNYNLYTSEQYDSAYQDGYNSANALVGVANVGFTGIFNVFSMLVNQMGIFGVSLAAVIITAVIILIIYAIFKIVKG